eukprot:scaffold996_cov409-Prasinococcus_capsulatus_cf.AAC.35
MPGLAGCSIFAASSSERLWYLLWQRHAPTHSHRSTLLLQAGGASPATLFTVAPLQGTTIAHGPPRAVQNSPGAEEAPRPTVYGAMII